MIIEFSINGSHFSINSANLSIDTSLGVFIREHAEFTGTKFMCREGGCGACIVMVQGKHPITKEDDIRAVNSVISALFKNNNIVVPITK